MKPKNRSCRACLGTLAAGTICLSLATAIEPHLMLAALITMFMLLCLSFALFVDVFSARARGAKLQFSLRQFLLTIAYVAAYVSLLREPWIFRLRFAMSRPALQHLAAEVEQGPPGPSPGPQWAGRFFIKKATREHRDDGDVTVLWTEPDGGSPSGFVHPAPMNSGVPYLFNDYSLALQNDPEWFYFIQD